MSRADFNVLVVEDDASLRAAIGETLSRAGYKFTLTGKADEVFSLLKIKPYQAAIIDCMLPKMNGVDLAHSIRKAQFGSGAIILMSGVFKDKSFQATAVDRVNAQGFLTKPFSNEDLLSLLDQHVKPEKEEALPALHALISKPFSSPREVVRVIERLEQISGQDLPFVLAVLMESQTSGFLNLVDHRGEIFGVTLNHGMITKVDWANTLATIKSLLVDKGFVSSAEVEGAESVVGRGDLVRHLVDQQLVSPHVVPLIRKSQLISDLASLFMNDLLEINFAPEAMESEAEGFKAEDLIPLFHDVAAQGVTLQYLENFYGPWDEFPIRTNPSFSVDHPILKLPLFNGVPHLSELLRQGRTIGEVCEEGKYDREDLYRAIHLLVFRRLIVFDDVRKFKSIEDYGIKMKKMFSDLVDRNPFEVFEYFGLPADPRVNDVARMYREFSRSNHPDRLPPSAPEEVRETVNRVFQILSEAHSVLTNDQKRQALLESLDQKVAERQIRAEALAEEAFGLLGRGLIAEALQRSEQALKLHRGRTMILAHCWALLKSSEKTIETARDVNRMLSSLSVDDRRNPHYLFVTGLMKREMGDIEGALAAFDKAIAANPQFLDARRERSATSGRKKQKVDVFSSDLSQIIHGFFKKRG